MDKDRLLTEQEQRILSDEKLQELVLANPDRDQFAAAAIICQDAKTAALVKAATLRAVGETLYRRYHFGGRDYHIEVCREEIEALCAGRMPEGWEK